RQNHSTERRKTKQRTDPCRTNTYVKLAERVDEFSFVGCRGDGRGRAATLAAGYVRGERRRTHAASMMRLKSRNDTPHNATNLKLCLCKEVNRKRETTQLFMGALGFFTKSPTTHMQDFSASLARSLAGELCDMARADVNKKDDLHANG
ncbi:unnamed protein product, partial [Strongylus vulgaris]